MKPFSYMKHFKNFHSLKIEKKKIPYEIGGLKNKSSSNVFIDYSMLDEEDYPYKENNFFDFFQSNLRISKKFDKYLNTKYHDYIILLNYFLQSPNFRDLNYPENINYDFIHPNLLKYLSKFSNLDNEYEKTTNYGIESNNLKNEFFLDKVFLHYNLNPFDGKSSKLSHIENIYSKKIVIFNYGSNNEPSISTSKKLIVRFSIWAKVSNYLIVDRESHSLNETEYLRKYKIHDDEWHHLLYEIEGQSDELNYLSLLNTFCFANLVSKFIYPFQSQLIYDKLKLADFDFILSGNPVTENEELLYKNELYYLKNNI
jgi:hypothetical protein